MLNNGLTYRELYIVPFMDSTIFLKYLHFVLCCNSAQYY